MRIQFLIPFVLALAACGSSDERQAGGVSPAEAEALDRAAEMLEAERLPAEAIPAPQQPEAASAAPKPAS